MQTLTLKKPLKNNLSFYQNEERPIVYTPQDNNLLFKSIKNALLWNKVIPKKGIEFFVEDGKVILTGEVQSWHQKNAATIAVESIVGVEKVVNRLIIQPIVQSIDVKSRIKNTFLHAAQIDADKINVEIQKDTAILLGCVRSLAEKLDAEYAARSTPGINRVFNYLKIIEK